MLADPDAHGLGRCAIPLTATEMLSAQLALPASRREPNRLPLDCPGRNLS